MDFCQGRPGQMMYDLIRFCVLLVISALQKVFVFFVGNRSQNRMIGHNLRKRRFAYRAIVVVCREKI